MKLVVISNPEELAGEAKTVVELFDANLERFHLRKPKYSTNSLRSYLDQIPAKYRQRIVIHSHHELSIPYKLGGIHVTEHHRTKNYWRSWLLTKYIKLRQPEMEITTGFHTIGALKKENPGYSYVFLSPVFDSITKIGYRSTFNEDSLMRMISKSTYKVIALGGVDEDKINKAHELGFYGVALMGSIWKSKDPLEKFKRIQQLCSTNVPM